MKRRSLLKNIGLAGGLVFGSESSNNVEQERLEKPVLRVAHLTDVHLKNEFDAPKRYEKCLVHVQNQRPAVNFIINGGDVVFDMNKENLETISAQWKLTHAVIRNTSSLPMHYCLGNHDIWWYENNKGQSIYGKKYALEQLKLDKLYYSFINNGWKFILLDSVHLDIDGTWYIGKLGDEQFDWLEKELASTPSSVPVLIMSHIPILTALLMIQDNVVNRWEMLGGDMHTDTAKIINLFYKHHNVKLCVSGHLHMRDKVVYNNVTYLCNGAVSGAWWKGNRRETAPGYGIIDLYADGSFDEKYINY